MPTTSISRGADFAAKRAQAQRNMRARIENVLANAAVGIAREARSITLVSSEMLFSQMIAIRSKKIIEEAEDAINTYIRAYAKASITTLGDKDTGATGRLLASDLFGKTFMERSATYMQYFFNDVIKMLVAGKRLGMSQQQIENAVKTQYKDPYATGGLIDRANRKGARIQTPAYGRGIYHSAYGNIVRNAQGTIAIAWGREEKNFARRNGAVGFRIHRGSSYPCAVCNEAAIGIHKMTDDAPPLHANCVCYVEYIYEEND